MNMARIKARILGAYATVRVDGFEVPLIGVPATSTEQECDTCVRLGRTKTFHLCDITLDEQARPQCHEHLMKKEPILTFEFPTAKKRKLPASREIATDVKAFRKAREKRARKCRACGCTDDKACVVKGVPCHWVEIDLCSACQPERGVSKRKRKGDGSTI